MQGMQGGKVWVPIDAYDQLLQITQNELEAQMHQVLEAKKLEKERKMVRRARTECMDFIRTKTTTISEKSTVPLQSPYQTIHRPPPTYRRVPPPDPLRPTARYKGPAPERHKQRSAHQQRSSNAPPALETVEELSGGALAEIEAKAVADEAAAARTATGL